MLKSIVFLPSKIKCNYRCWYCCVEEMNTKYEKRRMDNSTIQKIKNHILKIVKNGVNSLHIDWFGGEPLMYFNEVILPISTHAIELCKRHRLPFINQITTNGYYFNDEIIKACNTIYLNKFQIPIDGNETRHNMVKNIKGEGHFKKIIDNVNYICESIENSMVVLRINYDTDTLSDISEIIDFFPVKNRKSIFVDFQRIWQVGLSKDPISGENETLLQRKRDFEEAGFQVEYFAYRHRGFSACYSDNYYHRVINYDGKIYKCAARDYDDSLVIGRLCSDGDLILDDNVMSTYFGKTTFDNEKCLNCKILPLCYGPCVQHHYEIQKGKHDFVCRNDYSEISFQRYIRSKVTKK